MWKNLLPLKLLVDADDWLFFGKNETYILYFLPRPLFKKLSRATARKYGLLVCWLGSAPGVCPEFYVGA